jgi:LysR family cys regulon transcriptional activator
MNLRQLRYICEIAKNSLNISATAAALHTNQSGLSKQIKLLEDELKTRIFVRSKNRLTGITPSGQQIIARAQTIMNEVLSIKAGCTDDSGTDPGVIVVAVTHTTARYILPKIIKQFSSLYPGTQISMRHANPAQIVEMVLSGDADIGMTTNTPPKLRELLALPYKQSQKILIVPPEHKLLKSKKVTLSEIARYPLVAYEPGFSTRQDSLAAFEKAKLIPKIALSAIDADVIKSCVELGLGIAIVSDVTFDPRRDTGLRAIPVEHLFEPSTIKIYLSKHRYLRRSIFSFIECCDPHWSRDRVQQKLAAPSSQ